MFTVLRQSPLGLVRKLLARSAYTLRTGYWHTPERCCPDFPDEIFVNQLKVYRFASQFCTKARILDVGCGTGYGTSHLAQSAESAVGIDTSSQALGYARKHYASSNIEFLRTGAEALPLADRSIDFIISTENFEHLRDHRANLRAMSRVLTDAGMLLLATPNPEMFVGIHNRYHTHEFAFDELRLIVRDFFSECLIAENLLAPPTEEGRRLKEDRQKKGEVGVNLLLYPSLWGDTIDTTWLSNTHSFFVFARRPRRG